MKETETVESEIRGEYRFRKDLEENRSSKRLRECKETK